MIISFTCLVVWTGQAGRSSAVMDKFCSSAAASHGGGQESKAQALSGLCLGHMCQISTGQSKSQFSLGWMGRKMGSTTGGENQQCPVARM